MITVNVYEHGPTSKEARLAWCPLVRLWELFIIIKAVRGTSNLFLACVGPSDHISERHILLMYRQKVCHIVFPLSAPLIDRLGVVEMSGIILKGNKDQPDSCHPYSLTFCDWNSIGRRLKLVNLLYWACLWYIFSKDLNLHCMMLSYVKSIYANVYVEFARSQICEVKWKIKVLMNNIDLTVF